MAARITTGSCISSAKDSYLLGEELNRGGTAVVYRGKSLSSGDQVALKVMSRAEGKSLPFKTIEREIKYTAALDHPNIVRLLDYAADEQQVVICYELIDGPDMLDLLNERGGRLREADAAFYLAQLLRGVSFIHANGFCHRDLKPENAIVDRATNRVKIIDFGLSKRLQSAVTLGTGTPDYLAPELLGGGSIDTLYHRRTGQYDATATDVWALGVLLFLLVTGQYPFENPLEPQNVVATLQNIMHARHKPFPRWLSPQVADLIRGMLTLDPSRRLTLHAVLNHPWLAMHGQAADVAALGVPASAATPTQLPPPSLSYEAAASLLAGDAGVCCAADVAQQMHGAGASFASQRGDTPLGPDDSQLFVSAESSLLNPPSPPSPEPPRVPTFSFPPFPSTATGLPSTPKLEAPPAIAAVRAPPSLHTAKPPMVPVLVEGAPRDSRKPSLKPLVPAQSLEDSPTAAARHPILGLCRFFLTSRGSSASCC